MYTLPLKTWWSRDYNLAINQGLTNTKVWSTLVNTKIFGYFYAAIPPDTAAMLQQNIWKLGHYAVINHALYYVRVF